MPSHFSTPVEPEPTKGSHKKVALIATAAVAGVAAVVYLGGVAAFSTMFLPNTTLDGADVSLRPIEEVAAQKSASYDNVSTHVSGNGFDLTVSASDIDLALDGEAYVSSALGDTTAWAWPVEVFGTHTLTGTPEPSYDSQKLQDLISPTIESATQAAQSAGSAGISYDATSQRFVIDEGAVAAHVSPDAVAAKVVQSLTEKEAETTLDDSDLGTGTTLSQAADKANAYVSATQTLMLGTSNAYDLTAEKIAAWVKIADDLTVSLDTDAINEFCHGELTDLLDTAGTERTYTRPDGTSITVNDGAGAYGKSTYGWVIDGDKCAEAITAALETGTAGSVELPCIQTAATYTPGGQDWPDRYVDVDLTKQHAVFYDAGQVIWEADITSGQPNLGNETPTGVWTIQSGLESGDINLRGPETEDGTLEWDSHVQFWMPFVRNIVGFHNAPWQSVFGGNIYTYNGSHGCVRLDYTPAQQLFSVIKLGDVVVVHK